MRMFHFYCVICIDELLAYIIIIINVDNKITGKSHTGKRQHFKA